MTAKFILRVLLKLWLNTSPLIHLLTLVLAALCWWPGISGDFILSREALTLLHAQAIQGAPALYTDTWLSGPPLMAWLYQAFIQVFGSYGLRMLKAVFVIYLYLAAVTLPAILAEYRALKSGVGLAAALTVVLASSPWFAQEVHASFIALWPVTMAFFAIIRLGDAKRGDPARALQAGLWLGIATWVSFRMALWMPAVFVAYFLIRPARSREVFSIFAGWLLVGISIVFVLFLQGNLGDFWRTGFLGYLDQVRFGLRTPLAMTNKEVAQAWFLVWGPATALAIYGFAHFRVRYFSYLVRIRKVETVLAVWILSGLVLAALRVWRIDWSDILLLAPPTAFYAARVFELRWAPRLKALAAVCAFAFPAFQYAGYWAWQKPEQLRFALPARGENWRGAHLIYPDSSFLAIAEALSLIPPDRPIWILDQYPAWYFSLGKEPYPPYTDARLTVLKLAALPPSQRLSPYTPSQPESETFRRLSTGKPAAIIDPEQWTRFLSYRYPLEFGSYKRYRAGGYTLLIDSLFMPAPPSTDAQGREAPDLQVGL